MDAARASAKTRLWLGHEAESRAGQAIGQSCDNTILGRNLIEATDNPQDSLSDDND